MKLDFQFIAIAIIFTLLGCTNSNPTVISQQELPIEKSKTDPIVKKTPKGSDNYFKLVKVKTERNNKMELYVPKGKINNDALKELCQKKKSEFSDGIFLYIVIFDNEKNAIFPKTPFTAEYGMEEKALRHIKAFFTYNSDNNFTELKTYEKNRWQSVAVEESLY